MAIVRSEAFKELSLIPNRCLFNANISFAAKGLYAFLMAYDADEPLEPWQVADGNCTPRDDVDDLIDELILFGYAQRELDAGVSVILVTDERKAVMA